MKRIFKILSIGIGVILLILIGLIVYATAMTHLTQPKPSPANRTWQEYQLELASKKLRKGMTRSEVISTVGNPDSKWSDSQWVWRGAEDTNQPSFMNSFYQLDVVFSNNVVSESRINWVNYVY